MSFSVAAVVEVQKRLVEFAAAQGKESDLPLVEIRTFDSFATRLMIKLGLQEGLKRAGYEERIEMASAEIEGNDNIEAHLGQIRHLMVDEVQDLVGARAHMTLRLLKRVGGEAAGFTLLGDLAQGIYDFQLEGKRENMTSGEFLEEVRRAFPEMKEDVRLDKNFRVSGQGELESLARRGRELILGDLSEGAAFLFGEFERLESVGQLSDPGSLPKPVAVLCRDNGQLLKLASSLKQRSEPVSITPKKDARYLPPWIGLLFYGWETGEGAIRKSKFQECHQDKARGDVPGVDSCWRDLMRIGRSKSDRKKLDIQRLRVALSEEASFPRETETGKDSVTLSTIHRSKGREYDNVVVVMSDDMRPEEAIDSDIPVVDEDVEGETKVLFVGLTRARRKLFRMGEGARDGLRLAPPRKERWVETPVRTGPFSTYRQFRSIEVGLAGDVEPHSFVSTKLHGDLEGAKQNQQFLGGLGKGEEAVLVFSRTSENVPVFRIFVIHGGEEKLVGETSVKFGRDFRGLSSGADGCLRKFPHRISGLWISEVVTEAGESGRDEVPRELSSFPVWLGIRLQGLGRCEDWRESS